MVNKQLLGVMCLALVMAACHKSGNEAPNNSKLSYGDSVFYVQNQSADYMIQPVEGGAGEYSGFPEGIEINESTGAVTVNKSETGLRYRIYFIPAGTNDTITTTILISGINYFDRIYNLSNNDTLALPVYNGNPQNAVPGANGNSVFDEGGGCNGEGIAVSTGNGRINLAQTIRNGTFGNTPNNGSQKEVELRYRISDPSQKAPNGLKVKLYYFNTAADISPDLIQLLQDRQGTVFRAMQQAPEITLPDARIGGITKAAKPRPPCIFIVGR